jgi:hypothetical protein
MLSDTAVFFLAFQRFRIRIPASPGQQNLPNPEKDQYNRKQDVPGKEYPGVELGYIPMDLCFMDVPEPGAEQEDSRYNDSRKPEAIPDKKTADPGDPDGEVGERDLSLERVSGRPADPLCDLIGLKKMTHEGIYSPDTDTDHQAPEEEGGDDNTCTHGLPGKERETCSSSENNGGNNPRQERKFHAPEMGVSGYFIFLFLYRHVHK